MTSPAEPVSTDATQASQLTKPLRELGALVLLGANALLLFLGLVRLLVPNSSYSTFTGRAVTSFDHFVGIEAMAVPLLAVLLATHVQPVVPKSKLITQVALGEYAFSALFGVLTFLIALVGRLAEGEVGDALIFLLAGVAYLVIFAVAAFVVYKVWRTLYYVPRPKRQPGVYGQPQPGWPHQPGYPAQGGYPQPGQFGGQPGQQGGYPQPGQFGGQPGQQGGYPQPGQYGGQPGYPASPYNPAPASAPPFGVPQSAPPFGAPPSADSTQAIPWQPNDSTQAIPHSSDRDDDRTQRINPGDEPHPSR